MEGNYYEHRCTTWFPWKEGIKPTDIQHQLSAICGEKAGACSTVFNYVMELNTGKGIAQLAIHEWYRNTPKERFCEAIWKLPRTWQ